MTATLLGALLLATLLAWAIVVFNRLVSLRNQVRTAWVDVEWAC
jgi:LemA protein